MSFYQQLFTYLGGVAALMAALIWLTKTFISHQLSKELKAHEANLKEIHERNIAIFKKELNSIEMEHQVRFTELHERRAEAIRDIFERLTELRWAILLYEDFYHGGDPASPHKDNIRYFVDLIGKKSEEFRISFFRNQIFFPEEISVLLEQARYHADMLHLGAYTSVEKGEMMDKKRLESVLTPIAASMSDLKKEFRRMLNVDELSGT